MRPSFDQVSVVCVTFNSHACVAALGNALAEFANVFVVDNASTDGTRAAVGATLPHATLIANQRNLGFGAANNVALSQVTTPWALLLNPDCFIDAPTVDALLEAGRCFPQAALIAPQALRSDGSLQECYGPAFFNAQPSIYRAADAIVGAQWLSGCCLLLRTSCFEPGKAFDERFFLYYEDDDLALSAQRRGYECILVPGAIVTHVGNASSGAGWRTQWRKDFHYQRSKRLIIEKYCGAPAAWWHRSKLALAGVIAAPVYALICKRKYVVRWSAWLISALSR